MLYPHDERDSRKSHHQLLLKLQRLTHKDSSPSSVCFLVSFCSKPFLAFIIIFAKEKVVKFTSLLMKLFPLHSWFYLHNCYQLSNEKRPPTKSKVAHIQKVKVRTFHLIITRHPRKLVHCGQKVTLKTSELLFINFLLKTENWESTVLPLS